MGCSGYQKSEKCGSPKGEDAKNWEKTFVSALHKHPIKTNIRFLSKQTQKILKILQNCQKKVAEREAKTTPCSANITLWRGVIWDLAQSVRKNFSKHTEKFEITRG